jgi:hypothetical protein
MSALALASNPVYHTHTKHIEVDYHFVYEKVVNRDVLVKFVSTAHQIADVFTKGLSSSHFGFLRSKLMDMPPISLREVVNICPTSAENPTDHASDVENHVEIPIASYHPSHAVIHGAQSTNENHISLDYINLHNHTDHGVTYHDSGQGNMFLTTHTYHKGKRLRLQDSQSTQ